MRLLFRQVVFAILVALAVVTPGFADNLLINPGFESGDFTGWTVGGPAANGVATLGTAVPAYFSGRVNVLSGQFAAYGVVRGSCCTAPEPIILSQVLSVAPNQTLTIGFSASNWSASSVGASVGDSPGSIDIYVNGTPILLPVNYFLFSADQSWYNFVGTFDNGAASSITVDFRFIASGTGNFPASLDDFYVQGNSSAVPEPSSVLLLGFGLGGMAFAAWRRRK